MKRLRWQVLLGLSLLVLSLMLFLLHFAIFRDLEHILIYALGDLAFLPIEVLLVTLVVHQLLDEREKRARREKMNMVIGTFFSEVGTDLLSYFSDCDPGLEEIRRSLVVREDWSDREFAQAGRELKSHTYAIDVNRVNLENLREFLNRRRDFLLRLLENPNLLERESFTELLRAVFHLTEELSARASLKNLAAADAEHLAGDIKRAYVMLVHQWVDYMRYLKGAFPYLFSLAMRTNPFDEKARPELG